MVVGVRSLGTGERPWRNYANRTAPSEHRYNYIDAELLEIFSRGNGNVVISPLNIKIALAMLMEGASGETAEEIRRALRLSTRDGGYLRKAWLDIRKDSSAVTKLASRFFVSQKHKLNPSYVTSLMKNYETDVTPVNFEDPKHANALVNNWVAQATSGMITKVTDASQIRGGLILANAIYFNGRWQTAFHASDANRRCFHVGNECKMVPMMRKTSQFEFGYIPKLDADAILFPYEGGRFSMLLLLPKKKNGLKELTRDLLHVGIEEITSQLRRQEVRVEIPPFVVESTNELKPFLEELHIRKIFSGKADFSRMSNETEGLTLSDVLQSVKIVADEKGTEAAAAAAVYFVPLMAATPTSFVADHPFLFFIRDSKTGSLLFSGKIETASVGKSERRSETAKLSSDGLSFTGSRSGEASRRVWPALAGFRRRVTLPSVASVDEGIAPRWLPSPGNAYETQHDDRVLFSNADQHFSYKQFYNKNNGKLIIN